MARTVTISLSAGASGLGLAQSTYTPPQSPLTNTGASEGIPAAVPLATGSTTVTVPAGTQRALIVPPVGSVNGKTVKTTVGDTGIAFTGDVVLIPLVGITSLYFTAVAAENLDVVWG